MQKPEKASLIVYWHNGDSETIPVQFNPTDVTFDKSATLADVNIPGLDAPLVQFVRGQAEKVTLELFFDTTEDGTGAGATSVTTLTDKVYALVKIEPNGHAPPVCSFLWHYKFPGFDLPDRSGNQRRSQFRCVVENVKQKFTFFSPEGVPLRATLTVTLREYKTLETQLRQLNLNSPDRTQGHVVQQGETLSSIAARHYRRAGEWRRLAEENGIEDPRRLEVGAFLSVPPVD